MNHKKRILDSSVSTIMKKAIATLLIFMLCLNFIQLSAAAMENEKAADVSETGGVLPDNLPAKVCEKQDGISAYSSFPDKLDLSTSKYFPPIRNQEGNSCAAWAQVYYQFTYEAARLNDWDAKHDDSKVFSPKYVWNYLNKGSDSGLLMYDCYDFLKMQGAVRWTEFPQNNLSFEWYTGKNETETTAVLRNALKTRIYDYYFKNL